MLAFQCLRRKSSRLSIVTYMKCLLAQTSTRVDSAEGFFDLSLQPDWQPTFTKTTVVSTEKVAEDFPIALGTAFTVDGGIS